MDPEADLKLVHRVNWLRAKANFDRAREERLLVENEMDWTARFFRWHAAKWKDREFASRTRGHQWYAARQHAMWHRFATAARDSFALAGIVISST